VVDALVAQLTAKRIGVVAHFYMDPQVQGVLSSAGEWLGGVGGLVGE
jgi:quinolinate synthase